MCRVKKLKKKKEKKEKNINPSLHHSPQHSPLFILSQPPSISPHNQRSSSLRLRLQQQQQQQRRTNHVLLPHFPPPCCCPRLAVTSECARLRRGRGRGWVVQRPRHLLRGRRRLGHDGRGLRLRQPVQPGVRDEHRGAEHRAVQQRAQLRLLLRDPVRRGPQVVHRRLRRGDRHQLLPAQQRAPQQRRRVVQPSPAALRPLPARLPAHCSVQGRHCPCFFPKGGLQEEGRDEVHHQRPLLLQPGADHERGRRGGCARRVRQGFEDRLAGDVEELGPELAEQLLPQRPVPLLQGHHQRRQDRALLQCRPRRLVLRPDLQRSSVLAFN